MAWIDVNQEPDVTETHLRQGCCSYLPVDISDINNFEKLTGILTKYVELLIEKIEIILNIKGEKIATFTIGKTYGITKRQFRQNFNGNNPNQWKKDGLLRRYNTTYKNNGYNFLIGFGIITRHNVSPKVQNYFKNQEMLTLGLEMLLILHFAYTRKDNRLDNQKIHSGKLAEEKHAGGVLYVAIKTSKVPNQYMTLIHALQRIANTASIRNYHRYYYNY